MSISQTINAEGLVLLGWSRAILLQFAHPLVAAGVADHSGFRASRTAPLVRLHHTVRAMLWIAFGDDETKRKAIDGIRRIHRRVHGTLRECVGPYPAGTPYSAEDSALLIWVHATLVDSVVLAYEALVSSLSDAERDLYCRETAEVAVELGADAADVPFDWRSLQAYLQSELSSGRIVVGADARGLGAAVLSPKLTIAAAPMTWANRVLTMAWLPDQVRAGYGYDWTDRDAARADRIVRGLRLMRRATPRALATWPAARRAGRP